MKKLTLLMAMLFLAISNAQIDNFTDNDKMVYLDSLGRETTNSGQVYFRIIKDYKLVTDRYPVYEYYKSGKLRKQFTAKDQKTLQPIGKYTLFYESGNKREEFAYADKLIKTGSYQSWYENGDMRVDGEYTPVDDLLKSSQQIKINQYWDDDRIQQVTNGNGVYKEYDDYDNVLEGNIVNGLKDGNWTGMSRKWKYTFSETYKNGAFVSGTSVDSAGVKHKYKEVMTRPEPKGGLQAFYQYVAKNYRVPDVARLQGRIFVTFTVEPDGKLSQIKVLRDMGYGTGEEAVRILTEYKDFKPGLMRGVVIPVQYSLPITIRSAD